jgi:hypothetical protein
MATAQERSSTFEIPIEVVPETEIDAERRSSVLLNLSGEMRVRVEDLAHRTGYDEGELFNLAIALFKVCLDAVEGGHRVGVVDDDRELSMDFTGFHKNDPPGESF